MATLIAAEPGCASLRAMLVASLIGTVLALATPGGGAVSDVYADFKLPSGNIVCGYSYFEGERPYLRCEILSRLRPLPAKPSGCTEGVWGRAVGMQDRSRAGGLCITDTVVNPSAPVLGYGKTWSRGGFTCTSRTTGLTCKNRVGHGWFLSRERSYLF